MLKTKIITSTQKNTIELVNRRICDKSVSEALGRREYTALGLCEGSVADIIVSCDIAEKAADVIAIEIQGNCPQHMVCLGIFGSVAAVKTAVSAVDKHFNGNDHA
ncbi:hypothetical protein JS73_05790 [Synergistes jonesii]|nr:hypothetical protein JS72_09975 [Synergistes jonesii]OFB63181.1 hypothetical protein JS73_05790 [Synergistes jonesii]OFB64052.1 hypothetical protein JS79_06310 [Synergistes jonesii]OFB67887.1 hypothetical protein JS78_05800 [Synergistes jonesii]OFB72473.1 hypothetical protein JS77_05815 [Synergistes jonesii]